MKVGDKVTLNGQPLTVVWSSDDMTDEERRESAKMAGELMMAYGIEPMAPHIREALGLPEMSVEALMHKELAAFRDSDTRPKAGDAKQGSTRE